ncbi:MAG: metallophosphoesterase [Caulobacteraceae bacterium]|nr:metallophosphoesterase [Caulobacteraceae bacterium]
MRISLPVFATFILCLAATAASAAPAPAWVQLGPRGAEIRAVADNGRCPSVEIDGVATPMRPRGRPDAAFPATICQLPVPPGARQARLDGRPLPLPHGPPRRILIFGDTGCRVKGLTVQDCNNPRLWPFAAIARRAAAWRPDLVIHVGDYYYRESPCPMFHAECVGSPYGDAWATWRAEFFDPAAPLLATTPFVFARGNHESCDRGGHGWFQLLDAGPEPLACPAQSAPFRVDLGDLALYVLDSADADDTRAPAAGVAALSAQLRALSPDLARRPGWIVTHRPIWGLAPLIRLGALGPVEAPLNATQQAAVRGRDLSAVRMVVSGHVHHFAAYSFGPSRPAQLIAGTGGDIGSDADTAWVRTETPDLDGLRAKGLSFERFGYLLMDRTGADWVGTFRDLDDKVVATCRLHGRDLACRGVRPGR